ncbi:hypothetical protein HpBGD38_14660 [Helicobacter pylori]|uniref:hypothetical protein n=1 Tax=Helicobacter pylori TaxID=210 RepID=UPI0036F30F21
MKIKISFCSQDNTRNNDASLTNLDLARILEFRKWGYEYKMPYLDSTRQFRPMRRFVAKQGLPLAKIVCNALKGKHSENDNIAKDLAMRYKQYVKSGGLPFKTLASIKRNGVSLVESAQYIDSVYVKIESHD